MTPLSTDLRNDLARAIKAARRAAELGASKALESLAVHLARAHDSMDEDARALRGRLRAHGKQLGDRRFENQTQSTERLTHEVAYEHWHRMLFARFLAENHLLVEPESGQPISMDECREIATERGLDSWQLAASFAQRMLPKIFRAGDPALDVRLPPETRQALERELEGLPSIVFTSDDALGWTYQFWQAERKDAVNESGVKIGGDELPAVTQLFTDHYIVLFLFHNTIGAWRAAKILTERSDLTEAASSEEELRHAVRLDALNGYDFDYLRFIREAREGNEDDTNTGRWRPAAGSFDGWPRAASELRVLDPCCGSGHFLVEALQLLVRLRIEEEGLNAADAINKVLAENLFGLEIDQRCTQIAAFNLALAGWKLVGRPIDLPVLNIACSGVAPNTPKDDWLRLADEAAAAGGVPARWSMLERDESLWSAPLRQAMSGIYELFAKAPVLGSLIDPRVVAGDLLQADFGDIEPLLGRVLEKELLGEEQRERAVAAQGMARAATLLVGRYTLVITNVPYLGRGKQDDVLKEHLEERFPAGRADLATAFVQRCLAYCADGGSEGLVTPQNWLFLTTYRRLREELLRSAEWNAVARLGEHAFESSDAAGAFAAMVIISNQAPSDGTVFAGIDVSAPRGQRPIRAAEKAAMLRGLGPSAVHALSQRDQLKNPDAILVFEELRARSRLSSFAHTFQGIGTADANRYIVKHWEVPEVRDPWSLYQMAPSSSGTISGCHSVLRWENGAGSLACSASARICGQPAWGRPGLAIAVTSELPRCDYLGVPFDCTLAVVIPQRADLVPAVRALVLDSEFPRLVRSVDQALSVTESSFGRVPFDPEAPSGGTTLPTFVRETGDPTQWLFHGRPDDSTEPLQVAVARLLGHRWPGELDKTIQFSNRARELINKCDELLPLADRDGIVSVPSVRGEKPAADRLRSLLAGCGIRPDRDLDLWLRTAFFEEHCKLFHHRPFIWQVWDGRDDGFHALVNYHRLAAPSDQGRKTLQALTYSYLGDWIDRQRSDQQKGKEGADGRLAAALDLQAQLERILAGEPPYDIFVRWKPLHQQPVGWEPDINDGVRLNVRPFMSASLHNGGRAGAGILRWKPNISWKKDRGEEPESIRPADEYPWFWGCAGAGSIEDRTDFAGGPGFDGNRWNDLHYSLAAKKRARERDARRVVAAQGTS